MRTQYFIDKHPAIRAKVRFVPCITCRFIYSVLKLKLDIESVAGNAMATKIKTDQYAINIYNKPIYY